MFLLFFACTAPDDDNATIDVDPVPCGDGFGRGDDGNCYPIDMDATEGDTDADGDADTDSDTDADTDTGTPGPTYTSYEQICDDGVHTVTWEVVFPVQVDAGEDLPRMGLWTYWNLTYRQLYDTVYGSDEGVPPAVTYTSDIGVDDDGNVVADCFRDLNMRGYYDGFAVDSLVLVVEN